MNLSNEVYSVREALLMHKQYLNSIPELCFEEFKTSQYISEKLREFEFTVTENIAQTGVVGLIGTDCQKPCILFRADMDAIQIDANDPKSVKRVCGHDAHMAILLGLAAILSRQKNKLRVPVKLVFQPAEEGRGGAKTMIDQGVLISPNVDKVFALHMWSEIDEGKIGIQAGPVMASGDEFTIEVIGRGGHAALQDKCIDSIYIASQIVSALQSIISRSISPSEMVLLSIGSFNGGNNFNTICDKVVINGTCRTYNNSLREYTSKKIHQIAVSIAQGLGGKAKVQYHYRHPATVNSKMDVSIIQELSAQIVGKHNVVANYKTMCSEDFSHFLQKSSGAITFIGCKREKYFPQHSPQYYVGENAMLIGLELFYRILEKYCF